MGQHGSAFGSILLGLDGFEVTAAEVVNGEWQLEVQTTATVVVWAAGCGPRPMAAVRSRCGTCRWRPPGGAALAQARIWRCREPACSVRTWTERTAAIVRRGGADRAGPRRGLSAGRQGCPRGRCGGA